MVCCVILVSGFMVNPSTAAAQKEPPSTVCTNSNDSLPLGSNELVFGGYKKPTDEELIAKEKEFIREQRQKELQEKYAALEAEAVKSNRGVILEKSPNRLGSNCVYYVRGKGKRLPQPMRSLADKKRVINSKQPEIGAVAITREGPVGHVAIVVEVLDKTVIIEEGNYSHGYRTLRMIPKSMPLGYWVS